MMMCGCYEVDVWRVNLLLLRGLETLRNEPKAYSWFIFDRVLQDIVSKIITLNLGGETAVLDNTLLRGNELVGGGADPYHVVRLFTKLLPNARGVSNETLNRDTSFPKSHMQG